MNSVARDRVSTAGEPEVYEAVDLHNSRWPVAVIREALAGLRAEGFAHASRLVTAPYATGRDLLVVHVARQVCAIAALVKMTRPEVDPALLRIEVALVLVAAAGDLEAFSALRHARHELVSGAGGAPEKLGAWLGERLAGTGRGLRASLVDERDPLFDGPFHRALLAGERRLVDQLAVDLCAGVLDRERAAEHAARACTERLAFVEAVIGLCWADGTIQSGERQLVQALIAFGRFDRGERHMLRGALDRGQVAPRRIASDLPAREDRLRLIEMLVLAAFADGEFSPPERAYIDAIAAALGISEGEAAVIDRRVAEALAHDPKLFSGLGIRGRVGRSMQGRHSAIDALVRRNLRAVRAEIEQTGDLLTLLGRSVHTPLTEEEQARMRDQLLDICRTVPALALFAAPGGTILLPLLARVLPFSLSPSSFRDRDEAAF